MRLSARQWGCSGMGCGCGKTAKKADAARREAVRALALAHARQTGEVVAFFRCADYDFTTVQGFEPDGKTEVEYII